MRNEIFILLLYDILERVSSKNRQQKYYTPSDSKNIGFRFLGLGEVGGSVKVWSGASVEK